MKETNRRSFLGRLGLALGVGAVAKQVKAEPAKAVIQETMKTGTPEFDPTDMTTHSLPLWMTYPPVNLPVWLWRLVKKRA